MKRRSQPKSSRSRNTYAAKRNAGTMMYGPRPHYLTHPRADALVRKLGES